MKFLRAKIWSIFLGVILLAIIFLIYSFFKDGNYQTIKVERGNLEKITEISGKVVPAEEVDLSFAVGGTVFNIYKNAGDLVKAGDIIALLDKNEISKEIDEANALLRSESAKFDDLTGNISTSELSVKKDGFIKTLNKSFINSDSIIKNQVDIFFDNPDSRLPKFSVVLGNYFVRQDLGVQRLEIEKMLENWEININSLDSNNIIISDGEESIKNLKTIEKFLSIISENASNFEPTGDVTQSQIDSYLNTIYNARSTIASLIIDINTSIDSLREIESQAPIQYAKVENFKATVSKLSSRSDNYEIVAPFDGVVTSKKIEVGQVVSSGEKALTLISNLPFEIEAFIPEINIVGIDVGDNVSLKFDALGRDNVYEGVVSEVEPTETIKDGVTTYKIHVNLKNENKDLKSGMSANLEIHKDIIPDQVIIPTYVLIKDGNDNFVNLLVDGKIQKTKIEILDRDNRGNVSIKTGINVGDGIVIQK